MKCINCIVMILLIIGGINWGLVGLFEFNLVTAIFGGLPILVKIIYIVVGLAGLWGIYILTNKCCGKSCS